MTLLTLTNVAKAYAGVPALRGVSLTIEPGEIHALMGENGAGKSTLIKILAGVVSPDIAEIAINGERVSIGSPAAAFRLGLRFIHQELNVLPAMSVAENMFLGRAYPRRGGFLVDWTTLNATAREALGRLGIDHIDPRGKMARLSLADQMLVRISSAFLGESGTGALLYVMDEPTAALTGDESARLFKVLRGIREAGKSVIYVSHRLDEVMALCDRATVLRDGRTIDTGRIATITHDDLIALMIGRRVEEAYPPAIGAPSEETALAVTDLRSAGLKGLSLDVRKGEILGIAGLSGAGQNEALRALFGAQPASATTMVIGQQPSRPTNPSNAWMQGLAFVPRDRRSQGLVLSRSIFENITLPHLGRHSRGGVFLAPGRERKFATALAGDVKLKSTGPAQLCYELSGGNQQKTVFAKALAGDPKILLLDEPTRGIDVGAKFDLYTLIREKAAKGMAVLWVSSDLPELIGMCDRIAVMRAGELVAVLDTAGLAEETLLGHCYGRAGMAGARPSPPAVST